jgi:hypothetical protein
VSVVRVKSGDVTWDEEMLADHSDDLLQTLSDIDANRTDDEVERAILPPGLNDVDPSANTTLTWSKSADIIGRGGGWCSSSGSAAGTFIRVVSD